MRSKLIISLIVLTGVWLCFAPGVRAGERDPEMEKALGSLKMAKEATLPKSPKEPSSGSDKIEALKSLKSAKASLKKAAGVYRGGVRSKAAELIETAITELNNGDPEQKAHDYIRQAISEIEKGLDHTKKDK